MKVEKRYSETLKREIVFYIGRNAKENFTIIDIGDPDDLWFHAKDDSSCHVVVEMPFRELNKNPEYIKSIIEMGAALCKANTSKLTNIKNVAIIYTEVKNVTKTKTLGSVVTKNVKTIVV